MMRYAACVCSSILFVGCGESDIQPQPRNALLKMDIIEGPSPLGKGEAPKYDIKLTVPSNKNFLPAEQIRCLVDVTVPEGTSAPTMLQLLTTRNGTNYDSKFLEPSKSSRPEQLDFETTIEAPKVPGTYRLQVDALKLKTYISDDGKKTSTSHVVSSNFITIKVIKK